MVTTRRVGLKIKSGQRYILSTSVVKANCSECQPATPFNNLFSLFTYGTKLQNTALACATQL